MSHVNFYKINHNMNIMLSKLLEVDYFYRKVLNYALKIYSVAGLRHPLLNFLFYNHVQFLGVNTTISNLKNNKTNVKKFCGKMPKINLVKFRVEFSTKIST